MVHRWRRACALAFTILVAGCGGGGGGAGGADASPNAPADALVAAADARPAPDAAPALPDAAIIPTTGACGTPVERFDGTSIDWSCWDGTFTRDGTVTLGDALVLHPNGSTTFSGASLATSYAFTGDFDVLVSFALANDWPDKSSVPDNAHLDVTLEAFADAKHHISLARSVNSGGNLFFGYSADPQAPQYQSVSTSAASGKLRLTRTGDQLRMRYHEGLQWTDLATFTFTNEPAHLVLAATSVSVARAFTATLDDFSVAQGATDYVAYVDKPYRARADLAIGSVPNDYLASREWGDKWLRVHPLDALSANGLDWVRVGVTTVNSSLLESTPRAQWRSLGWHDELWSSQQFAGAILDDATARGMRLELFFFLSNMAAHAGMQIAPPEWAGLSVDETAAKIEAYTYATAKYYADRGLDIEVYDLGNEIDLGIVGFRPGDRVPIPAGTDIVCDVHWMRDNVWATEAKLLSAGIAGVRRVNQNAKIVLHTTGMFGLCLGIEGPAFFDAMVDFNVDFDIVGLSFYPGLLPLQGMWGMGPDLQRGQALVAHAAKLGKQVIIAETAYPHAPADPGTWSMVPGFPFTPGGQAEWMRAVLRFASNDPNIVGWMHFYPDHYVGFATNDTSGPTGLFETEAQPEPALLLAPNP